MITHFVKNVNGLPTFIMQNKKYQNIKTEPLKTTVLRGSVIDRKVGFTFVLTAFRFPRCKRESS